MQFLFASNLASIADIYVNACFLTAHGTDNSWVGVTKFIRPSVDGFLVLKVTTQKISNNLKGQSWMIVAVLTLSRILLPGIWMTNQNVNGKEGNILVTGYVVSDLQGKVCHHRLIPKNERRFLKNVSKMLLHQSGTLLKVMIIGCGWVIWKE
ncbi:hypothetical protein C5167_000261 [Papaver somniferum]|uniref:phosphoglycerate kinase n=1 Tax=Papaver somniferum TaxID=3469 RepID=A0A4Y7KVF9_PAPSO|nr:hypothetical protein C5167_000261 [Papaver somniferum]